jgi:hypothetical protein
MLKIIVIFSLPFGELFGVPKGFILEPAFLIRNYSDIFIYFLFPEGKIILAHDMKEYEEAEK